MIFAHVLVQIILPAVCLLAAFSVHTNLPFQGWKIVQLVAIRNINMVINTNLY